MLEPYAVVRGVFCVKVFILFFICVASFSQDPKFDHLSHCIASFVQKKYVTGTFLLRVVVIVLGI